MGDKGKKTTSRSGGTDSTSTEDVPLSARLVTLNPSPLSLVLVPCLLPPKH